MTPALLRLDRLSSGGLSSPPSHEGHHSRRHSISEYILWWRVAASEDLNVTVRAGGKKAGNGDGGMWSRADN